MTTATDISYGPDDFQKDTNVSRETLKVLIKYAGLLIRWQERLNLVGPNTLPDLWHRHMWDSAQILKYVDPDGQKTWLDIGTGAGFPGVVLAIMGAGHVHLVEKSPKKCMFLRAVAEETGAPVTVHEARTDEVVLPPIDYIVSRACAPLPRLLPMACPFFGKHTEAFFHKGQNLDEELTEATKYWKIDYEIMPSLTDDRGQIFHVKGLRRG